MATKEEYGLQTEQGEFIDILPVDLTASNTSLRTSVIGLEQKQPGAVVTTITLDPTGPTDSVPGYTDYTYNISSESTYDGEVFENDDIQWNITGTGDFSFTGTGHTGTASLPDAEGITFETLTESDSINQTGFGSYVISDPALPPAGSNLSLSVIDKKRGASIAVPDDNPNDISSLRSWFTSHGITTGEIPSTDLNVKFSDFQHVGTIQLYISVVAESTTTYSNAGDGQIRVKLGPTAGNMPTTCKVRVKGVNDLFDKTINNISQSVVGIFNKKSGESQGIGGTGHGSSNYDYDITATFNMGDGTTYQNHPQRIQVGFKGAAGSSKLFYGNTAAGARVFEWNQSTTAGSGLSDWFRLILPSGTDSTGGYVSESDHTIT